MLAENSKRQENLLLLSGVSGWERHPPVRSACLRSHLGLSSSLALRYCGSESGLEREWNRVCAACTCS